MLRQVTSILKPKLIQQLSVTRIRCKVSDARQLDVQPKTEKSINQVTLLGRVGAEPQKRGSDKHPVVIFSLATNNKYENSDGDVNQKTEWHRVSVFKPSLRDTVYTFMQKGQRVYVTGKISYGVIKDEAGNDRQTTSIIAEDVIFFQNAE